MLITGIQSNYNVTIFITQKHYHNHHKHENVELVQKLCHKVLRNYNLLIVFTFNWQYSLLNKVEEACREKQICKIMTDPGSFAGIDPCPGITKYAEVAYKCRPSKY